MGRGGNLTQIDNRTRTLAITGPPEGISFFSSPLFFCRCWSLSFSTSEYFHSYLPVTYNVAGFTPERAEAHFGRYFKIVPLIGRN